MRPAWSSCGAAPSGGHSQRRIAAKRTWASRAVESRAMLCPPSWRASGPRKPRLGPGTTRSHPASCSALNRSLRPRDRRRFRRSTSKVASSIATYARNYVLGIGAVLEAVRSLDHCFCTNDSPYDTSGTNQYFVSATWVRWRSSNYARHASEPALCRSPPPHRRRLSPAAVIAVASMDGGGGTATSPNPSVAAAQREHDWGVVQVAPLAVQTPDIDHVQVGMSQVPARAKKVLSHLSLEGRRHGIDGHTVRKARSLSDCSPSRGGCILWHGTGRTAMAAPSGKVAASCTPCRACACMHALVNSGRVCRCLDQLTDLSCAARAHKQQHAPLARMPQHIPSASIVWFVFKMGSSG